MEQEEIKFEEITNPDFASTNFFWQHTLPGTHQTFDLQTTLRGTLTPGQIAAHFETILAAIVMVVGQGGNAKSVGIKYNGTPQQAQPAAETTASAVPMGELPTGGSVPLAQPAAPGQPAQAEDSFRTKKLVVEMKDGKQYCKITFQEGRYVQYGLRVWPEVLASVGIQVDRLEAKTYDFDTYIAKIGDDGKGHMKVISLEKVA